MAEGPDLPSELPDEPNESDTKRDGFLSYATEFHSLAGGSAAGIVGAVLLGTEFEVVGGLIMLAVLISAFGMEKSARKHGIKVPFFVKGKMRGEVRREPWYAAGGMVAMFIITRLLILIVQASQLI